MSTSRPTVIDDPEFGQIRLIRNSGHTLRLNIRTNGDIVMSVPDRLSRARALRFLDESRDHLRHNMSVIGQQSHFNEGELIGRHHRLHIRDGVRAGTRISDDSVVVTIPYGMGNIQRSRLISRAVAKTLHKEAERYLPKRLHKLALSHGYRYSKMRLTYAKSRWGSCSTSGTISLNVSLMSLSDDLIDYVLMHELVHTVHMNHSAEFWRTLENNLPGAKQLSRQLRNYSPYI